MKKNDAYRTKKIYKKKGGGGGTKCHVRKKMENGWAPRKTNWCIVKKIVYLGYKEKECNLNQIGYFKMIPHKNYNQ